MVIDVGRHRRRNAVTGAVVAGALGLLAVWSAITGEVEGGVGTAIVAGLIGTVLLFLPIGVIATRKALFRPYRLVFDAAGLRWDDPRGAPWTVAWSELAALSISTYGPGYARKRAHARIDLIPADPGFGERHPEMAHLWEGLGLKNGYRLPLGSHPKFVPSIAVAMRRFAPHIYLGVTEREGFHR